MLTRRFTNVLQGPSSRSGFSSHSLSCYLYVNRLKFYIHNINSDHLFFSFLVKFNRFALQMFYLLLAHCHNLIDYAAFAMRIACLLSSSTLLQLVLPATHIVLTLLVILFQLFCFDI